MKPRIAYILKMYPRFSETFIVNEILELERIGMDVRIYALRKPDDGRFHASLARVKANVIYAPQHPQMEPDRIRSAHLRFQAARPQTYRKVYEQTQAKGHAFAIKRFLQAGYIANHLMEHPVDAVHAHFASSATRVANLVHRLTGLPYSFTAHAKDIFHEDVKLNSLRGKLSAARFVVTVSEYNRAYLESIMDGRPADIRCLYNGIDLQRFKPDPQIAAHANRILGVGRLVEKKGFDVLVRACGRLRDQGISFQCRIIGKGPEEESLKDRIRALDLEDRVSLLGPKPQDEVLQAYNRSGVFALPCVVAGDNNQDGLPTVLLEAMASGVPVVSTRLTGIPEIIDDGLNGFLVPPGDVEALTGALSRALADPARSREMGAAGRLKATGRFNVRRNVRILYDWLTEKSDPAPDRLPEAKLEEVVPVSDLPSPMPLEEIFALL